MNNVIIEIVLDVASVKLSLAMFVEELLVRIVFEEILYVGIELFSLRRVVMMGIGCLGMVVIPIVLFKQDIHVQVSSEVHHLAQRNLKLYQYAETQYSNKAQPQLPKNNVIMAINKVVLAV